MIRSPLLRNPRVGMQCVCVWGGQWARAAGGGRAGSQACLGHSHQDPWVALVWGEREAGAMDSSGLLIWRAVRGPHRCWEACRECRACGVNTRAL